MRKRRLGAGIMGDALEQLRREPEREATVTLAMPVRAGEAVPGIHQQIRTLGQKRRAMLVAHHEAAGQQQRQA